VCKAFEGHPFPYHLRPSGFIDIKKAEASSSDLPMIETLKPSNVERTPTTLSLKDDPDGSVFALVGRRPWETGSMTIISCECPDVSQRLTELLTDTFKTKALFETLIPTKDGSFEFSPCFQMIFEAKAIAPKRGLGGPVAISLLAYRPLG